MGYDSEVDSAESQVNIKQETHIETALQSSDNDLDLDLNNKKMG